jgi:hypothetical protein
MSVKNITNESGCVPEESVSKLGQNKQFLVNLIIWLKLSLETIYVSIAFHGNINTNKLYPISCPKEVHF